MKGLRTYATTLLTCMVVLACLIVVAGATVAQPQLSLVSKSAVLMDYATGEVLFEKEAHTPLPPASVTKIMTLTLALEALEDGRVALDTLVSSSAYAAGMGGTQIWLETNEQMSFKDLLFAIAVGSANDAAVAVAEHLGGSVDGFVNMMNGKARTLGMKNTQFSNPSGLPPSELGQAGPHVTTAFDLAILSRYALKLPMFLELVSTWGPVVMRPDTKQQPELWTFNKMLKQYQGMDGIKTGMTNEAGFCLAATAQRDNLRLIAVSLGAPSSTERNNDIAKLLNYGFGALQAVKVASKGDTVGEISVSKGQQNVVAVTPAIDVVVTGPRGQALKVETEVVTASQHTAPIKKGQAVAQLVVKVDGKEVQRIDLLALDDVERGSLFQIMLRTVRRALGPGEN